MIDEWRAGAGHVHLERRGGAAGAAAGSPRAHANLMPRGSRRRSRCHRTSATALCPAPLPVRAGRFDVSAGGSLRGCRRCLCANANNATRCVRNHAQGSDGTNDSPWRTGDGEGITRSFHRYDHATLSHSPQSVGRRLRIELRIATAKVVTARTEIQTSSNLGRSIEHEKGRGHIRHEHTVIRPSPRNPGATARSRP